MFIFSHHLIILLPLIILAIFGWLLSLKDNNVTVVDSLWAMFFLIATVTNYFLFSEPNSRACLILVLVTLWSFRLSIHLHLRNHNKPEDLRYQAIRARNQPNFRYKSLYLVFLLQAVLAWFIALPLSSATQSTSPINAWDYLGLALWIIGMGFQVIGDMQLSKFKSDLNNKHQVLNTGVWRYTRHPNYFGEACIWFAYGAIGMADSAWWVIISPIFMAFLLIKVTGVKLLEADIAQRRPGYRAYIQNTNSFFPWFPKN